MPNVVKDKLIPNYIKEAYLTQKRRKEYPVSYFLLVDSKGNRKFPVRDPKNGNYQYGLVRAAITRAGQYNYPEVEKKAKSILEKYFKKKKDFNMELISKDKEGKQVFGIVLMPDKKDGEGDSFSKEAIEDACYKFNKDFMNQSYRHSYYLTKDETSIVESYIAPCDMKIGDREIKEGTWLMRSEIKDEKLRGEVKGGNINGFSIGGFGVE